MDVAFAKRLLSSDALRTPSVLVLIAANSVPLFGVLFFGWNLFDIMFLYWLESAVIGFFNILKMLTVNWLASLFLVPFFCLHYGGFMFGHLAFIVAFFGSNEVHHSLIPADIWRHFTPNILLGLGSLFLSHGFSFIRNFIGNGEYKQASVNQLFGQPYGRIILMHLTLLFGGWLFLAFGEPVLILALMVVLKAIADISAHQKQRSIFSNPESVPA